MVRDHSYRHDEVQAMTKAKKNYLTKKQLKELRTLLVKSLEELGGRNREMFNDMSRTEMEQKADELDQASDETNHMLNLRIHDREQKLINKVRKVIENLDRGDYGYCISCSAPIGYERLKARPVAELCIDCKKEFEAREKRERDLSRLTGL
jgi:DnaK suppressor protein